jgi:basic membrane protein A and related proteins
LRAPEHSRRERKVKRMESRRAKTFSTLAAVLFTVILAGGCGSSSGGTTGGAGGTTGGGTKYKVALLTPGPVSDKGFNYAAYVGLAPLQTKYGVKTTLAESVTPDKEVSTMRSLASQGYNIIIGHGFEFGAAAMAVHTSYPSVHFIVHGGNVGSANVESSNPAYQENSYLAGIVAGSMTKNGRIGCVCYAPLGSIITIAEGVKAGAKSVNPTLRFNRVYTQSLISFEAARAASGTLLSRGDDLVFPVLGGNDIAAFGPIEAAHKMAIGFPTDETPLAPQAVVANQIVHFDRLMDIEVGQIVHGQFKGGIHVYGLKDGVVAVQMNSTVPASVQTKVKDLQAKIENGSFTPPNIKVATKDNG